jgi:tetratricopeptide (TPR) repeat protein
MVRNLLYLTVFFAVSHPLFAQVKDAATGSVASAAETGGIKGGLDDDSDLAPPVAAKPKLPVNSRQPVDSASSQGSVDNSRKTDKTPAIDAQAGPAKLEIREAIQKRDLPAVERLVEKAAAKYPHDDELRVAHDYIRLHLHDAKAKAMIAMMQMEGQNLFGHQWIPGRTMADGGWNVSLEAAGRGTNAFQGGPVRQALVKGYALLDRGESARAEQVITDALKRQGESAELYYARVVARGMTKNFNGADADSIKAVTLSRQSPETLSQRASLMMAMTRREEAYAWAQRAIKADPDNADALAVRGRIEWRDRHDPDRALKDLSRAAKLDPDDYAAIYHEGVRRLVRQRALNSLNKGDYRQAFIDASVALKTDPANADAHAVRGQVFLKVGHVEDAIKETTQALKSDPECENALAYRSIALETLGSRSAALQDMKRAAALNPRKFSKIYEVLLRAQKEGAGPLWSREAKISIAEAR